MPMNSGSVGQLQFLYDPAKDAWNIFCASRSKNNPHLTEVEQEYVGRYGTEFKQVELEEFVHLYTREKGLDMATLVAERDHNWRPVEQVFLERMEQLFHVTLPVLPRVYLTVDKRCAYNFEDNFFFVSAHGKFPNKTIMHELVHFYTWHSFGKALVEQGLPLAEFNDLKESLTELLNITCADLLGGARDDGYPQHASMRLSINKAFKKSGDVHKVVMALLPTIDSSKMYQLSEK